MYIKLGIEKSVHYVGSITLRETDQLKPRNVTMANVF